MNRFDHRKYRAAPILDLPDRQWPNRRMKRAPRWASVDLRDGNQALLEPMSVTQKQQMWALLLDLGFKEIEVGFPSASQPDYNFVRWLIEARQIPEDVTIQVLVQAREDLIVRTFEALAGAPRAIVHVYNSTSTLQRERVFRMDREEIKAIAVRGAQWLKREAARYPATDWTFQYSPESFSGTEPDYAVDVCNAVIDVWQPSPQRPCIINLPATVESSMPNVFADQVEWFCRHVQQRDSLIISVHTHNDRGCAVAAAEMAVLAGADRVEGTLLGNGERTGNMDIITMAMNLYSQGIDPELDLSRPEAIIATCQACTDLPVHPRHPWVGELVYTAFSGSHQDAIAKSLRLQQPGEAWQVAYLPIDPRDLGRDYQAVVRVNSQSGKGGVAFVLERDYGIILPRWMQLEMARIVQQESEQQASEIDSIRIHELFCRHFMPQTDQLRLQGYQIDQQARQHRIRADIRIAGKPLSLTGEGEGVLEAFIHAWQHYSGEPVNILEYSEHALGSGTGAEAMAYVQLAVRGRQYGGVGRDRDTLGASLQAVLCALEQASFSRSLKWPGEDWPSPPAAASGFAFPATLR